MRLTHDLDLAEETSFAFVPLPPLDPIYLAEVEENHIAATITW